MLTVTKIYLRNVETLNYVDPGPVLLKYRELEIQVAASDLPINVKTLRTSSLKQLREGREAALFALGVSHVQQTSVLVALAESADYDFVLRWCHGDEISYCPVQLKELVSEERSPDAAIETLIRRASNRPKTNTILLVRLNRNVDVDVATLPLRDFPYRELWLLWQSSPDGSRWSILGDALTEPRRYDYDYPDSAGGTV